MENEGRADDLALLAAIHLGSERAFAELIDRHQQAVRAFLRRIANGASEADDLAQETFLAAWRQAGSWRGEASVRSWLCAIAWRKAKSAARSWARRQAREEAYDARAQLQRSGDTAPEDAVALKTALAELPLEQRAAVALCLGGEFSHAEAACVLGLPLGTVKSHVARGRAKLLDSLGGRR